MSPQPSRPARLAAVLATLLTVGLVAGCAPGSSGEVAAAVGTPAPTVAPTIAPTPTPVPAPTPTPTPVPTLHPAPTLRPTPSPTPTPVEPYEMNLYGKGDFVSQSTPKRCVAAAMQIMLNIVGPKNDRSTATQGRLATLAKQLSDHHDHGTEPLGWARGLEKRGAGEYEVSVAPSMGRAVRRAVEAIRRTGRPVGLLVWRGAHSWVLHGFRATADPAVTDDYDITGLWVSDPWYPRISSIWGPSREPNQRITVKQLREDYLKWRRPTGRYPGMDGKWVLVLPVGDAVAA